jgi:hypothetical protein
MPEFDRDPLQRLREVADAGREHARGLPADEVRALGSRRQRRRMAASVAGVCAVVVIIAGGVLSATGQMSSLVDAPQPADAPRPSTAPSPPARNTESPVLGAVDNVPPSGGWMTEIPGGYPLARNLPAQGEDGAVQGPGGEVDLPGIRACGSVAFPLAGSSSDMLGLRYTAPEVRHVRQLVVYEDAVAAQAALRRLVDDVAACPREELDDGVSYRVHQVRATDLGDTGVRALTHGGQQGFGLMLGSEQHHLVRVGNAVLRLSEAAEYMPDSDAEQRWLAEVSEVVGGLAQDLCVFDRQPCQG